jgi:RecA/RadA recombinase
MNLIDRLKKNSTLKETDILGSSKFFSDKEFISTSVPAINIALQGCLDGGFSAGLTQFVGPSKHFKTGFTLLLMKSYLDKYKNSMAIFYDSEFGTPQSYFSAYGIDMSRVLHCPISNLEDLKFDLMKQLEEIKRGDKVFIAVDSIGNLASKKEVDDAMDQKSVADMSRAKQMKSLFRMVTPVLTLKQLSMVVVNHSYKTQELYSKDVVSGGTGSYYSSDNIFIIGRQQEKDGTEVTGYNFVINIEKSRYTREKMKIPISISHTGGISKWSGLLDMALESGHVVKPSNGWYSRVNTETGEVEDQKFRERDTNTSEFWNSVLSDPTFAAAIKKKYQISNVSLLSDDNIDDKIETLIGDNDD